MQGTKDVNKQPNQSQTIKNIITLAKNNVDVEILWLYGSHARNKASMDSDCDLAVTFKSYIEEPIEHRLRPEILALKWVHELGVDLSIRDINQVPLSLAYTVVQDNSVLYSKNDGYVTVKCGKIQSKF